MGNNKQIRNIIQSVQEREIIKTAPDMVVYIDGLPFIINPYLKQDNKDFVAVNFNDYVTAISANYSLDNFIPTASINLSVPNGYKQLFMAPGGNTVIDVMSEVRIYAKSYFFSATGNTVYRRIFNGMIRAVDYNELQTGLEIAISCSGICHLLEIIQTSTRSALMSYSPAGDLTLFRSKDGDKEYSLYVAIYNSFCRELSFEEFIKNSIQENLPGKEAIKKLYIDKWALRLDDLKKQVRIFGTGYKQIKESLEKIREKGQVDLKRQNQASKTTKTESTNVKENLFYIERLKNYTFDQAIGNINLIGDSIVPRIERIRQLVDLAGLEGYQDIDGSIIVKPPLYNLDCTVLGGDSKELSDENLYENANPFIINMAEVLSEAYQEDESGIRRTTMTLAPNFGNPNGVQIEGHVDKTAMVRHTDINLIRRFGIREEPAKYVGWLGPDMVANFGFAISELSKVNRNFRTYHCTIPLRPELRLGFPIFVPHKDMYAYLTGVSISYNVGGQATMSLTTNFIRKRPLFPQIQTVTDEEGTAEEILVYASQPNYVMAYTKKKAGSNSVVAKTSNDPTDIANSPATIFSQPSDQPTDNESQLLAYRRKKVATHFTTWTDSLESCWRIQKDDSTLNLSFGGKVVSGPFFDGKIKDKSTGVRTEPKPAEGEYLRRCSAVQPYTDEKGYEVISCLPWGRYATLREALVDMTRTYYFEPTINYKESIQASLKSTSAFLLAGFALPDLATPGDAAREAKNTLLSSMPPYTDPTRFAGQKVDATNDALLALSQFDKSNVISFEMSYDNVASTSDDDMLRQQAQANNTINQQQQNQDNNTINNGINFLKKVQTFLSGSSDSPSMYQSFTLPQNLAVGGFNTQFGLQSAVANLQNRVQATFSSSVLRGRI
jgi:hypothetical protein